MSKPVIDLSQEARVREALSQELDRQIEILNGSGLESSELLQTFMHLKAHVKACESALEGMKEQIKARLKGHAGLRAGGFVAIMRECHRTDVDRKALQRDLGDAASKYLKESSFSQLIVSPVVGQGEE